MAVAKKTCVDIAQKVVVATKGGENKTCVEIAQNLAATQEAKKRHVFKLRRRLWRPRGAKNKCVDVVLKVAATQGGEKKTC